MNINSNDIERLIILVSKDLLKLLYQEKMPLKDLIFSENPSTVLEKVEQDMKKYFCIRGKALRIKNTKKESKKIGKYTYCQTDAFKNQRPFGCNCLMKKGRAGT